MRKKIKRDMNTTNRGTANRQREKENKITEPKAVCVCSLRT